jgi:hypothetical protein
VWSFWESCRWVRLGKRRVLCSWVRSNFHMSQIRACVSGSQCRSSLQLYLIKMRLWGAGVCRVWGTTFRLSSAQRLGACQQRGERMVHLRICPQLFLGIPVPHGPKLPSER